ncbi:histidine phosphatase family protein [Microlunatus endophyticus]|uniref:histidine phosphatase family protein n=1 Tax=Microlunatus endophyticus TaxID=1716077 RepID=UPI0016693041|nr:histidine phosphatase family protein [Microlunatus endophyticus]
MTFETVYLARHGRTRWNEEHRRQGQLDSPLTAAGEGHAAGLARLAATLDLDLVASSPIGRARSTAIVCADAVGMSLMIVDELAEVHHGRMAGLTTTEADTRFPGALDERSRNKYRWRFPGGESYADADERAAVALGRIQDTGARQPLIISHEMIGRMLLRNLVDADPDDALSVQQPHDVVFRVEPLSGRVTELRS